MTEKIEVGDLVEVTEDATGGCYVGPNPWTARVERLFRPDATEILVRPDPPIPGCKHERMALSSHDNVRLLEKGPGPRRDNRVCGLVAGLFQEVEEALLRLPADEKPDLRPSRARALRCLTEIHDQFDRRHSAATEAERDLRRIWGSVELARHKLHQAHVDFGGTWEPKA